MSSSRLVKTSPPPEPPPKVLFPEVVDPRLAGVEKLAWIMDRSIHLGQGIYIGLDGIIGLIPGLGDLLGAFISSFIVARAVQLGLPRVTIMRMVVNIAIDTTVGTIPVVGDAFDFAFKANSMNVELMRRHLRDRSRQTKQDWLFLIALGLLLLAILAVPVVLIMLLIRAVF